MFNTGIDKTGDSGNLRDERGIYDTISELKLGYPLTLLCPPRVEGAIARLIQTPKIVSYELSPAEIEEAFDD
jgi:hypothetical protein